MTAKEIVFGKAREITPCFSKIDFLCSSFLYAFSFLVQKYVHEAKKNFQLQLRNCRSRHKIFGYVCNSSNLIASLGT